MFFKIDNKIKNIFMEWASVTVLFAFAPILLTLVFTACSDFENLSNVASEFIINGSVVLSSFSLLLSTLFEIYKREESQKNIVSYSLAKFICLALVVAYTGMIANKDKTLIEAIIITVVCLLITLLTSFSVEKKNKQEKTNKQEESSKVNN